MNLGGATTKDLILELVRRGVLNPSKARRMFAPVDGPAEKLRMADKWISSNGEAYAYMTKTATGLAGRGIKFGARLLTEEIRWGDGVRWSIMNNIIPYVMFRMVQANPKLKGMVTLKIRVPRGERRRDKPKKVLG